MSLFNLSLDLIITKKLLFGEQNRTIFVVLDLNSSKFLVVLYLSRYVDMKTRKVLTIDHCFEILLNRVNGMTWKDAIIKAIPARKGAQLKDEAVDDLEEDERSADQSADSGPPVLAEGGCQNVGLPNLGGDTSSNVKGALIEASSNDSTIKDDTADAGKTADLTNNNEMANGDASKEGTLQCV